MKYFKLLEYVLKCTGLLFFDINKRRSKMNIIWMLYGVFIHLFLMIGLPNLSLVCRGAADEIEETFVLFTNVCNTLCLVLIFVSSRGLAEAILFLKNAEKETYARYAEKITLVKFDTVCVVLTGGIVSGNLWSWGLLLTQENFQGVDFCIFVMELYGVCATLSFMITFRTLCTNVGIFITYRLSVLGEEILQYKEMKKEENKPTKTILLAEAEDCEYFLLQVEKAKEDLLRGFFWGMTVRIMGAIGSISYYVGEFVAGYNLLNAVSFTVFLALIMVIYGAGESFSKQVTGAADALHNTAVGITHDALYHQVMRVEQLVRKISPVTLHGAYTLQWSSFVTVLNSLLSFVIIILQMKSAPREI